jgi:hypothetical protein
VEKIIFRNILRLALKYLPKKRWFMRVKTAILLYFKKKNNFAVDDIYLSRVISISVVESGFI